MNINLDSKYSVRAVNTSFSIIKTNLLMLYWEIFALCSEKRKHHKTTLCGQTVILNLVVHTVTTYL
jgi:hypothetical protein